jgi:hypothetical protein
LCASLVNGFSAPSTLAMRPRSWPSYQRLVQRRSAALRTAARSRQLRLIEGEAALAASGRDDEQTPADGAGAADDVGECVFDVLARDAEVGRQIRKASRRGAERVEQQPAIHSARPRQRRRRFMK